MLLEACIDSLPSALAVEEGGADRIELNAALELDGLTPSIGLLKAVKQAVNIPVIPMLRPRAAGFCYTPSEFDVMLEDLPLLLDANADGIVFGILHEDRTIDVERCQRILQDIDGPEKVFHRAFDVVPNPSESLEILIDLGFDRILTSGQAHTAPEGAALLGQLIEQAAGRITILPGAGINPQTYTHSSSKQVARKCTAPLACAVPIRQPNINPSLSGAMTHSLIHI